MKTTYTLLAVFALLFAQLQSHAQKWTNYTTADGLLSNTIWSIDIDAQGNKWFGTFGGVTRFDGTNWTNFAKFEGLSGNAIKAIAIDAQGNKWFGTYNGVFKFDGDSWTAYNTANGLVGNNIKQLQWIASEIYGAEHLKAFQNLTVKVGLAIHQKAD